MYSYQYVASSQSVCCVATLSLTFDPTSFIQVLRDLPVNIDTLKQVRWYFLNKIWLVFYHSFSLLSFHLLLWNERDHVHSFIDGFCVWNIYHNCCLQYKAECSLLCSILPFFSNNTLSLFLLHVYDPWNLLTTLQPKYSLYWITLTY